MSLIFIFLILIFIFSVILNFLLIKKEINLRIDEILISKKNINYFSKKKGLRDILTLSFIPHPFTNFSLNPKYVNKFGYNVHTIEGFRKTSEEKSILEKLNNNKINIVCIGGSTTQCANMDNYQDTWPSLLENKFENKVNVFNFGVGAWTTLHSYIRCINWLPKIKADIIIFYQAKNDLTPFRNGDLSEDIISNDYQNIMSQYSDSLSTNIPFWFKYLPFFKLLFYFFVYRKRYQEQGILNIYKPRPDEKNLEGLKRFNNDALNSLIDRYEIFFDFLKKNNSKVIYIPEIVHGGEYEKILEKDLFPNVKKLINNYNNIMWFDLKSAMPFNDENFIDKMHFSKKGNILFSNLIFQYIKNKIF